MYIYWYLIFLAFPSLKNSMHIQSLLNLQSSVFLKLCNPAEVVIIHKKM